MDRNFIIDTLKSNKGYIKITFHIKDMALFGSYSRDEQAQKSDIDILVEFEDQYKTFKNYMALKLYLENLFNSKIDLVSKTAIKDRLKEKILKEILNV
ncbi:nucleotidyltransferase family protein [Thermodesulfobium sp. 4217-1]|uniref:nucleotidyltransferase family protein n=1 Tax=Thermodesulfobium sp. 4217-1 TaxID=3120013 RepID=UPI0032214F8C